jgi:imidazolonepropionase-like amidohydrolase
MGTVEVRKGADLILVPGDPTDNIRRLEEVPLVMQGGRIVHNNLRP